VPAVSSGRPLSLRGGAATKMVMLASKSLLQRILWNEGF
jgi:hypothetical protein